MILGRPTQLQHQVLAGGQVEYHDLAGRVAAGDAAEVGGFDELLVAHHIDPEALVERHPVRAGRRDLQMNQAGESAVGEALSSRAAI